MDEQQEAISAVTLFYSYAREDELLRAQLEKHLSSLRREGLIADWHDRQIVAGTDWAYAVNEHLKAASVILLLISSYFMASDYCSSIEMQQALERHKVGEARVIPIILRPVDWQGAPFAHLQCLPPDGKPVTTWRNRDEAFLAVARGIRIAVEELRTSSGAAPRSSLPPVTIPPVSRKQAGIDSPTSTLQGRKREWMLERVRTFWIDGVLEQSLHGAALIALELHQQPEAVANPWMLVVQESDQPGRPLPPRTPITEVYDDAQGELLILGEPGCGKTTLLLELARDLLDRAQKDRDLPVPVVFNLSSWAAKQQPIADWLVEELNTKYQVPHKFGQPWIDDDLILPLLDGLDEVSKEYRAACIDAINAFRRSHGMVPTVVCSRSAEYLAQQRRIELRTAVVVQPFTAQQVDEYLASAGGQLEGVRLALHEDSVLQELAASPLMLSILTLAYQGEAVEDGLSAGSASGIRRGVFATYVQRMLKRRGMNESYTKEQTLGWLTYLAQQMKQHSQAVFYIERMQPDWLEDQSSRQRFSRATTGLIFGLVGALCLGPVGGLNVSSLIFASSPGFGILLGFALFGVLVSGSLFGLLNGLIQGQEAEERQSVKTRWPWRRAWRRIVRCALNGGLVGLLVGFPYGLYLDQGLPDELNWGLTVGVIIGSLGGLGFGLIEGFLSIQTAEIRPKETFAWSWIGMGLNLVKFLVLGFLGALLIGLLPSLVVSLSDWVTSGMKNVLDILPSILGEELQFMRSFGLLVALISGLVGALTSGWSSDVLDKSTPTTPNQGIRRSAYRGALVGAVGLVVGGVLGGLLGVVTTGTQDPISYGLIVGTLIAVVSGLQVGGVTCIQHAVLRWSLWRARSLPLDYPRFLDYAAERILLHKVGGGYIFVHRLLLDYFTSLASIMQTSAENTASEHKS